MLVRACTGSEPFEEPGALAVFPPSAEAEGTLGTAGSAGSAQRRSGLFHRGICGHAASLAGRGGRGRFGADRDRRAARQGVAILVCRQVVTRLPVATHGHATIFFGMDRGGRSNGVRNAIELRIDVGKVRRRLLARGGRQVGVQFGLCAIYCGLSVDEGLGRIDRGSSSPEPASPDT